MSLLLVFIGFKHAVKKVTKLKKPKANLLHLVIGKQVTNV